MLESASLRPPEEAARRAIDQLDLTVVVARCRRSYGWSEADAEAAVGGYRRHLLLCYLYPESSITAIDRRSDLLWHEHILDTVRYRDDCQRLFGAFLHHIGVEGEAPTEIEEAIYEETLELYRRVFGERPIASAHTCFAMPIPPPPPPPTAEPPEPPAGDAG